jgi:hypothetical protein
MKKLLVALILGYVATASLAVAQPSDQEQLQIFPKADYCRQTVALNGDSFCEAWRTGYDEDPDELIGYVLLKTLSHHGAEMRVLVGIGLNGVISKVLVKGPEAIDQEFLAQFEGKNARSNFEIVKTIDDLLFVPSKLKAITGKMEICEDIAKTVAELIKSASNSPKLTFSK